MNVTVLFVDLAAKSVVVVFVAWLLSRLFRNSSAAVKHLVWLSAFCVLLVAPVLTAVLPARAVPLVRPKAIIGNTARLPDGADVRLPAGVAVGGFVPTFRIPGATSLGNSPRQAGGKSAMGRNVGTNPPTATPGRRLVPDWSLIGTAVLALWLLGATIVALQSLHALIAVGRLRRGSKLLEGNEVDRGRLARQLGVTRPWELRICAGPKAPAAMTWGVMNPVVIIPQESASWTTERLEAVLLHELAHVRRFDSVSQLISVLACAVYWFNPAVWLCARAMRAEAEIAADDTVLGMGVKPSDYARELVRIAAELGTRRQPYSTIGVPVMKKSKIESRVQAILDPSSHRRRGISTVQILTTAAIAASLVIPVSMLRATLVPIEPRSALIAKQNPQEQEVRAKKEQERAELAALQAKLEAEKAGRIAEKDKKAAEAQRMAAEFEKAQAELDAKSAAEAGRTFGKARAQVLEMAYKADRKAKEQAIKAEKLARLQQLKAMYARDQAAKYLLASLAHLKAQMASMKAQQAAQQAQLLETQVRLKEALRRLQEAKAGNANGSYKERLQSLYEQGIISKGTLESKAKAEADKNTLEALSKLVKANSVGKLEIAAKLLKQAKIEVDAAKAASESARQRYEAGVITKDAYDKAVLEYQRAESRLEISKIEAGAYKNADRA